MNLECYLSELGKIEEEYQQKLTNIHINYQNKYSRLLELYFKKIISMEDFENQAQMILEQEEKQLDFAGEERDKKINLLQKQLEAVDLNPAQKEDKLIQFKYTLGDAGSVSSELNLAGGIWGAVEAVNEQKACERSMISHKSKQQTRRKSI
jgi:hypothetical protein